MSVSKIPFVELAIAECQQPFDIKLCIENVWCTLCSPVQTYQNFPALCCPALQRHFLAPVYMADLAAEL